jgi:thiol-disulfide isomerase/thioredoxin
MHRIGRRQITAGLAGATLALAAHPRKPWAQTVLTPRPESEVELRAIDTLKLTEPPASLASQVFTDADGHEMTPADFLGKGLVLNLWATWCGPCVAELPALDRLAALLDGSGILVLPLSSDRGGAAVVRKFYAAHNIDHLGIYLDKFGLAASGWKARGLPTTLIVDRAGRERARLEGGIAWDSEAAVATIRKLTA